MQLEGVGMAKRQQRPRKAEAVLEAGLAAVIEGGEPRGIEALDHYGIVQVIDPNEQDTKTVRTKIVHLRDDPIGLLHKRRQLGDVEEARLRLAAAREWQRDYEAAEQGGSKAMDPTKEVVDGGGAHLSLGNTDARLQAMERLGRIRKQIGLLKIITRWGGEVRLLGSRLLIWVLGEKLNITGVAERLGYNRNDAPWTRHLIDCLDVVAIEYGLSLNPKRRTRRPRGDKHSASARYANNPELHRAVRRAKNPCR